MAKRLAFLGLALAGTASANSWAQTPKQENDGTVAISGFVNATLFAQDQSFLSGNGQAADLPDPRRRADPDPWFFGGDVRDVRLTLFFRGPVFPRINSRLNGLLEWDFFGPFVNEGFAGDEQQTPRLRHAYADFTWARTILRVGQAWTPLLGHVPESVSHINFSLGYACAGSIGWRFPGIYLHHTLTGPESPATLKLQAAVFHGSWQGPEEKSSLFLSAGNASPVPQFEARLDASGISKLATWAVYAVGHYDQKDLSGVGNSKAGDNLEGIAGEVGGRIKINRFLLHGNAYYGRAIGQQFGHMAQIGDIIGWGGWLQLGVDLADDLELFFFSGIDDPNDDDVLAAISSPALPMLEGRQVAASLRFRFDPCYFGLEWLRAELLHGSDRQLAVGNQISTSLMYKF